MYSYTFPVGPGDLRTCLETLMAHCREKEVPFQLHNITKEHFALLDELYPGRFEIRYERDYADYVYEADKLARFPARSTTARKTM